MPTSSYLRKRAQCKQFRRRQSSNTSTRISEEDHEYEIDRNTSDDSENEGIDKYITHSFYQMSGAVNMKASFLALEYI